MTHPRYPIPCPVGTLSVMPCLPAGTAATELSALRAQGVTHIVSMLPVDQAGELGMQNEAALCAAAGIVFLSYPIQDFGLPEMTPFAEFIDQLTALLASGAHLAVHCKAGIGRSGMVAACVLIAFGATATHARKAVSDARGVSIPDTVEQGTFIGSYAAFRTAQ